MPGDARHVLGLGDAADAEDVRAARRRLAKHLHPDAGGDDAAMRRVNAAADVLLRALAAPDAVQAVPDRPDRRDRPMEQPVSAPAPNPSRVDHDVASFVIEALPVDAFEALMVVTSWIGELVNDEPPYQLDALLDAPMRCWCRLELVPDAGASTVAVTIAALDEEPLPEIDRVRDLWVASINRVGGESAPGSVSAAAPVAIRSARRRRMPGAAPAPRPPGGASGACAGPGPPWWPTGSSPRPRGCPRAPAGRR